MPFDKSMGVALAFAGAWLWALWRGRKERLKEQKQLMAIERDEAFKRGHEQALQLMAKDSPWPLVDVMQKLIEATDHLLIDHSCDTHGHELFSQARDIAQTILDDMLKESHDDTLPPC